MNCSELVLLELGLINSSKTLIGLFPVYTSGAVTKTFLLLYFMKKTLHNPDGSNDLVTVVTLAHHDVNKTLILSILKKIMDKYFEFRKEMSSTTDNADSLSTADQSRNKPGEFKMYMTQIIKFEEMQYESNQRMYNYGSINRGDDDSDGSGPSRGDVITPNQLLLANEEVGEVRLLMLDNINKLMNRGDKINSLVDQTDRLTSSSLVFQRKAQAIKRKMWFSNAKFWIVCVSVFILLLYFFIGFECGFPLFGHCIRH